MGQSPTIIILLDLLSTPRGTKKVSNLEIIIILLDLLSPPRGTKKVGTKPHYFYLTGQTPLLHHASDLQSGVPTF